MATATETWTREKMLHRLREDPRVIDRAVVVLDDRQTPMERAARMTRDANGEGWNAFDARFGSSLAARVRSGRSLTERQRTAALRMLRKYTGQLCDIANARR